MRKQSNMFLCRRFLSSTCSFSLPSLRRLSSVCGSPRQRDYMANSDCRAPHLRDRVAFLIRLSDLDAAAKHARLAPFAEYDKRHIYAVDWVCGAIIVAMFKAKRYRDALDLICYFFKEHKMTPPKGSFNHVLKGVVDDPSNATMTLLGVKRLAHAGSFDESMDPFRGKGCVMCVAPFGMSLDVSSNLIRGLLDLGDFKEAHKLFFEIRIRNNCNRTALASAPFMEYWFKRGKEEEAMEFYQNLLVMDLTEIEATGAIALLDVLLKCDKKTQAWELFHYLLELTTPYLSPEPLYRKMVDECFKMGWFYEAIQTFNKNLGPGPSDYGYIITRFCELGMLPQAEHFFAEMRKESHINPHVSTYKALIDTYAKAGRVDDVLRISNDMVDAFLTQMARISRLYVTPPGSLSEW